MRKMFCVALAAGVLGAAAFGLAAPAGAAPVGADRAQTVINDLHSRGYRVQLTKVGSAPLDQCTVTSVRAAQPVTHRVSSHGGQSVVRVLYVPVHVHVKC
jgi:hypothetical protein